jgi:hypothetical protein
VQRRPHRRIELLPPARQLRDDVVERPAPLDRAERKLPRQRPLPRLEPARLGVQGLVGERAVLGDPADDLERGASRVAQNPAQPLRLRYAT